jgi:hypothetical protein
MSFGDGSHRCPGSQVALHETRIFIDRLLRVPGIELERAPEMHWSAPLMSYELRNAIVACDRSSRLESRTERWDWCGADPNSCSTDP